MIVAQHPKTEVERLEALQQLEMLDSAPEAAFDSLTRMASTLLGVPIAVVSLVDASRQWFKSQVGLDVAETSREVAFCAHAILGDEPFVVPDAMTDVRFADNPLVVDGPKIRAYAGVPLRTTDGHAIGTLCAMDQKPRRFSDQQIGLLKDLAEVARREILHRETSMRARRIADESLRAVSDSESLYHATFDRAAIGIAIVGLDGRWQRMNPTLCNLLGRTPEELQSMTSPYPRPGRFCGREASGCRHWLRNSWRICRTWRGNGTRTADPGFGSRDRRDTSGPNAATAGADSPDGARCRENYAASFHLNHPSRSLVQSHQDLPGPLRPRRPAGHDGITGTARAPPLPHPHQGRRGRRRLRRAR